MEWEEIWHHGEAASDREEIESSEDSVLETVGEPLKSQKGDSTEKVHDWVQSIEAYKQGVQASETEMAEEKEEEAR